MDTQNYKQNSLFIDCRALVYMDIEKCNIACQNDIAMYFFNYNIIRKINKYHNFGTSTIILCSCQDITFCSTELKEYLKLDECIPFKDLPENNDNSSIITTSIYPIGKNWKHVIISCPLVIMASASINWNRSIEYINYHHIVSGLFNISTILNYLLMVVVWFFVAVINVIFSGVSNSYSVFGITSIVFITFVVDFSTPIFFAILFYFVVISNIDLSNNILISESNNMIDGADIEQWHLNYGLHQHFETALFMNFSSMLLISVLIGFTLDYNTIIPNILLSSFITSNTFQSWKLIDEYECNKVYNLPLFIVMYVAIGLGIYMGLYQVYIFGLDVIFTLIILMGYKLSIDQYRMYGNNRLYVVLGMGIIHCLFQFCNIYTVLVAISAIGHFLATVVYRSSKPLKYSKYTYHIGINMISLLLMSMML